MIFNVAVDTVIQNWLTVVWGGKEGTNQGLGE